MSQRPLRVHPDVLNVDLPVASAHYDERDRRLGARLSHLIVDAINQIEAHPLLFAEYIPGFRRVVLVPSRICGHLLSTTPQPTSITAPRSARSGGQ